MKDFPEKSAVSAFPQQEHSHSWFARTPIRFKLTLIISATAGLALLLAVLASVLQERDRYREETSIRLASMAQIVGLNSQAAILFQDVPAMERSLNLLAQNRKILMAALYNAQGQRLASYNRDDTWQAPVKVPAADQESGSDDYYWLSRVVRTAGQEIGVIWIATDTSEWKQLLTASILRAAVIFVVLVILVVMVSVRLQRSITGPIEELQRTTHRIIQSGDYRLRASTLSDDELADVVRGFNHMLDLIENRASELNQQIMIRRNAEALLSEQKQALQRAHNELEDRVADRTRQLEATRDLAQQANQAKTEFLTNISHELRTPMNAIIGYSELLREEATDAGLTETMQDDISRIQQSARHLLGLIDEILDFSKIEAREAQANTSQLNLVSLISNCIDQVRPQAMAASNKVVNQVPDSIGRIESDEQKVSQILINLLGNACKFTSEGSIHVDARRYVDEMQREWVLISVADTGIGMSPETQAQIFEPFRQVDNRMTRRFGGAGLGLAIARGHVELLGGRIDVESVPGEGSTFTVHLPAQPIEATGDSSATNALHNRLIVAVTDKPQTEQELRDLAARTGMLLRLCSSENELDALLELSSPETILIDLELGDLNGWKIYRSLKTQSSLREIPTVLADLDCRSQDPSPEEIERLIKPVQPDLLRKLIAMKCPGDRALGVLVVEDDPDDRAMLSGLLGEMGHHVIEAEDGILAMSLAQQTFPDLILLDIALPYKSGLDVLAELRSHDTLSDIPVIIVSCSEGDTSTTRLSLHRKDRLFRSAVHPEYVIRRMAESFMGKEQA